MFSLSLGDWLDNEVPIEWLADMLDVIRRCPDLTFLLLTKRPENFEKRLCEVRQAAGEDAFYSECKQSGELSVFADHWLNGKPPSHVWLGTSVENQAMADLRIPQLLKIPAAVRFLSVEPLLEEIVFKRSLLSYNLDQIDWVIVGGESGDHRRDCGVEAIVSVANQCKAAGVPVFVKQAAARKPGQQGRIPDSIWQLKQFPK